MEDPRRQRLPARIYVLLRLYELEDEVTRQRLAVRDAISTRQRLGHLGSNPTEYIRSVGAETRARAALSLATMSLQDHARRAGLDPWQERQEIPDCWRSAWTC